MTGSAGPSAGEGRWAAAPPAIARPSRADAALLGVAVLGVGASAPMIAATAAPALAIAMWRNAMGTMAVAPYVLVRHRDALRDAVRTPGVRRAVLVAAVALAVHFGTWVPAVTLTSVASATALAAIQPVWNALLAVRSGQHLPGRAWLGIAASLGGVVVLTGADLGGTTRALVGDALALVGGMAAAVYVAAGAQARRQLPTSAYATVCYGGCALLLLVACLVGQVPLAGYPAEAWLLLVGLTVLAQLLGHTVLNRVLGSVGPVPVALAILLEVPAAAVIAALWLGQLPPPAVIPAAVLILGGVALVVTSGQRVASDVT